MTTTARQHIKRMRGGAQAHLMCCSDGQYYVVKFQNNPQHRRVLANDFLASKIALLIGLPVPAVEIVDVPLELIESVPALTLVLGNQELRCSPGLQFGSRYAVSPLQGQVFDYLPADQLDRVRNLDEFAGILALDKWTCNVDGRQAAFWRRTRERKYWASFIDQGYCFNAGDWTFTDFPLRGVFPRNEVYAKVKGWESFEPWLTRIKCLDDDLVWDVAQEIPPEWYDSAWDELAQLVELLLARKTLVESLIANFRDSPRRPFPEWRIAA